MTLTPATAIVGAVVALYGSILVTWITFCVIGAIREGYKRWKAGELKLNAVGPRSQIE